MAQHFLKSAAYRNLTPFMAAKLSEEEAYELFVNIRWGDFDNVTCPECSVVDKHYYRKTRKQWRCKHCDAYFSVTSGTKFNNRKLTFSQLITAVAIFAHKSKGISFHDLSGVLGIQIKTAQVLIGKLREVIGEIHPKEKLSGLIHIDGGHFGGRPRHGRVRAKSNVAIKAHVEERLRAGKKRQTRRSWANNIRYKNRRIVMTLRQLHNDPGKGAEKTIVAVCMSENERAATNLALTFVEPGSTIMTDENPAYNQLSKWFNHQTVQHAVEFATLDGISDNQAESFFSRLRRFTLGVAHRIEPKYMADIALEMAWREDVRRNSQLERVNMLLKGVLSSNISVWWTGYWQGINRPNEILWSAKC